jgi:YD repeat-containing protein
VKYSYDDLQRVTRVDHSDNTFKEYQYASKVSLATALHQWVDGVTCLLNAEAGSVPCYVDITLSIDEEHKRNVVVTDDRGLVLRSIDGDNVDGVQHSSNYWYGAFNRLIQTHDNRDFVTSFDYDDYGRLRAQTSPDSGKRAYTYNGFDELNTSTDPKVQVRTYHHDLLGRTDSIIDAAGTTQWTYDQGVNAKHQLCLRVRQPGRLAASGIHD